MIAGLVTVLVSPLGTSLLLGLLAAHLMACSRRRGWRNWNFFS